MPHRNQCTFLIDVRNYMILDFIFQHTKSFQPIKQNLIITLKESPKHL